MAKLLKLTLSFFFLFIFSETLFGQNYKFKFFGTDDGLSQQVIYNIVQDKKGYLWAGTGEGLCRFDGIAFQPFFKEDGLADNYISATYIDQNGRLWVGHKQGGISLYDYKNFESIATDSTAQSAITGISEDGDGNIWAATQNNGIIRIDPQFQVTYFKKEFEDMLLFSLHTSKYGKLVVGTNEGLYVYEIQEKRPVNGTKIEDLGDSKIQTIVQERNGEGYWIGTEDLGVFKLIISKTDDIRLKTVGNPFGLGESNIKSIFEDNASNLWIGTSGEGVFKLSKSRTYGGSFDAILNFNRENGLQDSYIESVFQDRDGNIWVGTFGTGMAQLVSNAFVFYLGSEEEVNISSVFVEGKTRWFGLDDGLMKISTDTNVVDTFKNDAGLPDNKVTAIYRDSDKNLWVGTEKNGIFFQEAAGERFQPFNLSINFLSNQIVAITENQRAVWVGTKNGVYSIDKTSREVTHFNIESGLPHNNINHIFMDHAQVLWVATASSNYLTSIENEEVSTYNISSFSDVDARSIFEDDSSNIWLATSGAGIFKFDRDSFVNYTTDDGLKSNYCYSIVSDEKQNVWIGHTGGMTQYIPKQGIFQIFDQKKGFKDNFNANAVYRTEDGKIWFGTSNGVVAYDAEKDVKNTTPPLVDIQSVIISDSLFQTTQAIQLRPGVYKIEIQFLGLSLKNPEKVTYQYKLEGYDLDWSDVTTSNYVKYDRVENGEFVFRIIACNSDGVCSEENTTLSIIIAKPWYKKVGWIIFMIVMLIGGVIGIVKWRERNHKKVQAYLESTLEERTKEVQHKNTELEKKNKDITDSINYAERIQRAILPEDERLKEFLPDSFIFFRPRDIVSGDFYWFKKFDDHLIFVCADCTGHGVPGAFMSLIGTTLLRDICSRQDVTSPDKTLYELDTEIRSVLKQKSEENSTQDGMDVAICEINLKTNFVRIASAMRPAYVIKDNELIKIKGSRFSIGGTQATNEKKFDLFEMQLNKGDKIYLFSDGYPDQFGGPHGKKFKVKSLINMVEEIKTKPMQEQQQKVAETFDRWIEGYEQIDDVLFTGIQI